MIHVRFAVLASFVASMAATAPVGAHAPLDFTEESTSVECNEVSSEAGTVRLTASVSTLSGATGFLLYWAAPADPSVDPPTLVSIGTEAAVQADGSVTATYDMFTPGDLGITDAEPVFVGTAQLIAAGSGVGPIETIDEVTRNGNRQFRIEGTSQALAVTGSVTVPTAGSFELAGCSGEREMLAFFGTQPDADVSAIERTSMGCFWLTDDGFVAVEGQADENDAFIGVSITDGSGAYFGLSVPALTPDGIHTAVGLDSSGSATISADFTSVERINFRDTAENHWVMVTIDTLSVEGTILLDTPAGTAALTMDDASCLAEARSVRSLTTSPSG